jgi:hypothetical protein
MLLTWACEGGGLKRSLLEKTAPRSPCRTNRFPLSGTLQITLAEQRIP